MNKKFLMVALAASLCGCGNDDKDNQVVTLDDQSAQTQVVKASPCVIEVPGNDPQITIKGKEEKYYNFCDNTVTTYVSVSTYGATSYFPVSERPIKSLEGTELQEKDAAYAKYKQTLGLK